MLPGVFEFPVEQDVTTGTIWEGREIWVVPFWVEGDLSDKRDYDPLAPLDAYVGGSPANELSIDQHSRHRGSSEWNRDTLERVGERCLRACS